MTVKELYEKAKGFMFEKSSSRDYDGYYKTWINSLLSENFTLNNQLRIKHGKEPLEETPFIELDQDELPYEEEMCYVILPYGLAANFFIDDDLSKFDIFNTYYVNARAKFAYATQKPIEDVYGGWGE